MHRGLAVVVTLVGVAAVVEAGAWAWLRGPWIPTLRPDAPPPPIVEHWTARALPAHGVRFERVVGSAYKPPSTPHTVLQLPLSLETLDEVAPCMSRHLRNGDDAAIRNCLLLVCWSEKKAQRPLDAALFDRCRM